MTLGVVSDAPWPSHILPMDEADTRSVVLAIGFATRFIGGGMAAAPVAFYGARFVEAPTSLLTTWPGWISLAGLAGMSVGAAPAARRPVGGACVPAAQRLQAHLRQQPAADRAWRRHGIVQRRRLTSITTRAWTGGVAHRQRARRLRTPIAALYLEGLCQDLRFAAARRVSLSADRRREGR